MTDLRYALRTLTQRPGFSVAAILSLAVGIAANTAVFSVTNGLLFKRVPGVHRPDGLVHITHDARGNIADLPHAAVRHLRGEPGVIEQVAAFAVAPMSVVADGEAALQGGLAVDADYFSVLGARPARGRLFAGDEASYPRVAAVAVISEHLWRRELGGRDDAIGRTIHVNGAPVRVIGVVGGGFTGHHVMLRHDVFLPLGLAVPGLPTPRALDDPRSSSVEAIGRLRAGVTPPAASAALTTSIDRFRAELGAAGRAGSMSIGVHEWGPLPLPIRGGAIAFLAVLSVLVGLALSMACINVTTMLLARATERRREIAVRQALGASRGRLVRQMLTEALVLFVVAGAAGTGAALLAARTMSAFSPRLPIPGRVGADVGVDLRVLAVALAVTLGAGILFSLAPALRAARLDLVSALKAAGGTSSPARTGLRSVLVGVQVGVTTLLLIAAGLFVTSLADLAGADTGFRPENVEVLEMDLELRGASAAQGEAFYSSLLERVRAMPGVSAASLAAKLPIAGCSSLGPLGTPDAAVPDGEAGHAACFNRISPDYFRTLSLPLVEGRDVAATDVESAPRVAVLNQTLARRLFPQRSAVGRTFTTGAGDYRTEWTVIGVVGDAKYRALDEPPANFFYIPAPQMYNAQMVLHVRAEPGRTEVVTGALRGVVRDLDPYLPLASPRPLAEALELFFFPQRVASWVATIMGMFALLLATIGVYGVTAYVVASRARELGIRLALGASGRDVMRLVLRRQLLAPAIGIVLGGGVGLAFSVAIHDVLRSVQPGNPVAFGGVAVLMAAIVLAATLLPTLRLLRGSPMVSILSER